MVKYPNKVRDSLESKYCVKKYGEKECKVPYPFNTNLFSPDSSG